MAAVLGTPARQQARLAGQHALGAIVFGQLHGAAASAPVLARAGRVAHPRRQGQAGDEGGGAIRTAALGHVGPAPAALPAQCRHRLAQQIHRVEATDQIVGQADGPHPHLQLAEEMGDALRYCREAQNIGVVVLTGAGDKAFCAGGDMNVKGRGGYVGGDGVPRLNVLDVQKQIRSLPKPVIAMVNGFAIGGGHVLHLMCDLTIASENAIFGQTGPKVGSFDAGFGASYLARIVGQKKAREIWFMCRQYSAAEAERMGMVNKVVPFDKLEDEVVEWAETMMERSPLALRMIKAGLNAELDGQAGIQELAGDATMLYYMLDEAQEGGRAFLEKRKPDFKKYPKLP